MIPTVKEGINQRVLAGKEPVQAARELVAHNRPDINARQYGQSAGIATRNRINFEAVELSELEPYKVIKEMMTSADKVEKRTKEINAWAEVFDEEVGRYVRKKVPTLRDVYVVVPDWDARLAAAKMYFQLTGGDPRLEPRIQINNLGGSSSVQISFGTAMAQIGELAGEEDQYNAYAELKQAMIRGEISTVIETERGADGSFKAKNDSQVAESNRTAPDDRLPERSDYDSLPEERF